jgi:hypothetical protein
MNTGNLLQVLFLVIAFIFPISFECIATVQNTEHVPMSQVCERIEFSTRLTWTFSATWDIEEEKILLTDPLRGRLFAIDRRGNGTDLTTSIQKQLPDPLQLSEIKALPGQNIYLIEDEANSGGENRFLLLGRDFSLKKMYPIGGRTDDRGSTLLKIYSWEVSPDGERVIAFGDLRLPGGKESSAFVAFSLHGRFFKVLDYMDVDSPQRVLYMIGYRFLSMGDHGEAFFVRMDGEISLRTIRGNKNYRPESVTDVPIFGATMVTPPVKIGLSNIDDVFRSLAKEGAISSVFNWHSRTFLLMQTRTPESLTPNLWHLREINTETGEEVGSFRLPTVSPHVMVVLGEQHWAIIEKGPIFRFGLQFAASAWIIPTHLLEDRRTGPTVPSLQGCYWEQLGKTIVDSKGIPNTVPVTLHPLRE